MPRSAPRNTLSRAQRIERWKADEAEGRRHRARKLTGGKNARYEWLQNIAKSEFSSMTRLVAHTLALHGNTDGGRCYPSGDAIAFEADVSVRTVSAGLAALVRGGWLLRNSRGTGGFVYDFCLPGDFEPRERTKRKKCRRPQSAETGSALSAEGGSALETKGSAEPGATSAEAGAISAEAHDVEALKDVQRSLSSESLKELLKSDAPLPPLNGGGAQAEERVAETPAMDAWPLEEKMRSARHALDHGLAEERVRRAYGLTDDQMRELAGAPT